MPQSLENTHSLGPELLATHPPNTNNATHKKTHPNTK